MQVFSAGGLMPGFRAAARDWQRLLGPDAFALSLPFLAETGTEAPAIHCPLGCGCAHEVVLGPFESNFKTSHDKLCVCRIRREEDLIRQSPPTESKENGASSRRLLQGHESELSDAGCGDEVIAACVCDEGGGCPDIVLKREELHVLELCVERLGREVARALHCRPLSTVIESGHLWQIGTWSSDGVPVLMTLDASVQRLTRVVELCAARFRSRIILLVDDPSLVSAPARAMLDAAGSGFFGLSGALRQSAPGRLAPRKPPEELFCAFTASAPEEDSSSMQKAFALLQKLEGQSPGSPPGLATVFKLYCMDNLPASEIARKCGCSKTTIIDRLARIRRATGLNPAVFRKIDG